MNLNIAEYKTLVFDCDGVVLNSNKVKTDAFYNAALDYGEKAASSLVEYHIANGGISRYKKFTYFLEHIVRDFSDSALEQLLTKYASCVHSGLLSCDIAPGLGNLRKNTPNSKWLIVSGGDQQELREIFEQRDIHKWFDGGIFGSPDNKEVILSREIEKGNISKPALFLGDSKYDYQAAKSANLDFVFLTNWSEVRDYQSWVNKNNLCSLNSIGCLATYETK